MTEHSAARPTVVHPAHACQVAWHVESVLTLGAWVGVVAVRLAVFVGEQGVPAHLEFDEHDRSAVHVAAVLSDPIPGAAGYCLEAQRRGMSTDAAVQARRIVPDLVSASRLETGERDAIAPVIGTARLIETGPHAVRIGRVAVLPGWRGQGVGRSVMRLLERVAIERGAHRVTLHAQLTAQPFYLRQGYTPVERGTVFIEDGIPHVSLGKSLERSPPLRRSPEAHPEVD